MNSTTDLEQVLRGHFDNNADRTALDGQLDRITDRVATVRQRPGWAIPERWLPMSAISSRFAAAPRLPLRVLVVAMLVLAVAVSVLLVAGALRHTVPPPFGPAANGLIAYTADGGAIVASEPATGHSVTIVPSPGNDRPTFSPDGTRVAFLRIASLGRQELVVVNADGTGQFVVTPEALVDVKYFGWSPDERSIAVASLVDGTPTVQLYEVRAGATPVLLAKEAQVGSDNFNAHAASFFRPPDGRQILYLRHDGPRVGLFVAEADGTNARPVIDPSRTTKDFDDLWAPQWSPDGTKIAVQLGPVGNVDQYHVFVMNADGTGLRQLTRQTRALSEANAAWSPDGTKIAIQRWYIDASNNWTARPVTVIGVEDGIEREVGIVSPPGYNGWAWSPDGLGILQAAGDEMVVVNIADGVAKPLPWKVGTPPSWQRTAR